MMRGFLPAVLHALLPLLSWSKLHPTRIYYRERGEEKGVANDSTTTPNADCFAPTDPIVDCREADREKWEGRREGRSKVQWH